MITVAQILRRLPAGPTAKILADFDPTLDVRRLPVRELERVRGFNINRFLAAVAAEYLEQ